MNDLISIVIPIYMVENYLNRCIDSVIKQSYSNLEIILVDDGSPDRCGEICDYYASIDQRIRVLHKQNGGLSDARNAGIDFATGRYITFLDSDDWVNEKYIEILFDLLKTRNADISICNFLSTSDETIIKKFEEYKIFEYSNLEALNELVINYNVQMTVAYGKIYHIDLFKAIRYPVGKIHEDVFTTYKLLYKADKIVYTTEPLLYYWQRPDSITGSGFKIKNTLHKIEALEERMAFFNSIGEKQLCDKTANVLFGVYKSIKENIHMVDDKEVKKIFLTKYKDLKSTLRNSKQSLKFKLYYELYFISPNVANLVRSLRIKQR